MKTKIILQKDIPSLGVTGDVKEVSPGYARNFLLPRRLAVLSTERTRKIWEARKEKIEQERKEKLLAAEEQGRQIRETVCTLAVRSSKEGKLYGSVTTADVANAFQKKGLTLDRRWIQLSEAIKTTGEFSGNVRLHPQVSAAFKIIVNAVA